MNRWAVFSNKKQQAFTIVELIIVIFVIGILAAITIIGYSSVTRSANETAVKDDLSKFADAIKLKALDDQIVPDGGSTSLGVGSATVLNGITFKPNSKQYDTTVFNFIYCAGYINGIKEFAIIAKSKSGGAFSYKSNVGVAAYSGYTFNNFAASATACSPLGFVSPYTWSYGYNPSSSTWYSWATP